MDKELVGFLEELGAGRVRHSRRTLLEHLVGVAAILERWGAPDRVWKAGLFHSVYGTEYFKDSVLPFDARPRVREKIGEDAERLAWIFCAFDRGSLYRAIERGAPYEVELLHGGGRHGVTEREIGDLVWLVWANALEQVPHLKPKDEERARSRKSIARVARYLPDPIRRELEETY